MKRTWVKFGEFLDTLTAVERWWVAVLFVIVILVGRMLLACLF